jgi:hypothetical protein
VNPRAILALRAVQTRLVRLRVDAWFGTTGRRLVVIPIRPAIVRLPARHDASGRCL